MTGLLHEREFSRKTFVKGGGAMIVGLSLAGTAGRAQAAGIDPFASPGPGDPNAVDSFLMIHSDNTASLRSGRIELGQGSTTALRTIAAEELDMDTDQIRHIAFDTGGPTPSPNTGNTGGSTSISQGGPLVRKAAAEAKQSLLKLASVALGVPVASLTVSKGVVSGGGKKISYGELIGDKLFNVRYTGTTLKTGEAPAKPVSQYTQVGIARIPRDDIPDIVSGVKTYAANVRVPGMLHGRVVRPRGQGAYGDGINPVPLKVDESSIKNIPDVKIVRVGNFLGVVAPKEYDAIQAAAQLKVAWSDPPKIFDVGNLWRGMREFDSKGQAPARIAFNSGNVDSAMASAAKTWGGTFKYHYQMHAPIGPNVAVADVTENSAIIYSHVKNGYGVTRPQISAALNSAADLLYGKGARVYDQSRVRVVYYEGASSFGGGAAHVDNGETAAIMSMAVGAPVRVQWMRWDEHGWDNYGPATMWDVKGGIDGSGNLVAWDATSFGMAAYTKTPSEVQVGQPIPTPGNGPADTTYSGTQYNIPNRRIVGKTVPVLNNYFKTSTLRAPNAMQTCFANEQVVDHLAYLAGMDPYQFRLKNISTAQVNDGFNQWRDALVAVAKAANWQPRVANSVKQTGDIRKGRGIAMGGFAGSQAANVADIEVNVKTGKIVTKHMAVAVVAGLMAGPALAENNMSGALIMGVSRALHEEVAFDKGRVTSLDWVGYPLLRFKDHPSVTTVVVQRTDLQPTGNGEPPTAAAAAAIANAFFDATGVRLYEAPMTAARVRATLKAAGFTA
ncbi:MAG TPA: molybdopterin cofactor-binding domain-containing protein [Gaiellaceae bacterium]|nr:molybdopterin cofactor-binding domain-containing protein [Gaiellaceae bacterium]